MSDYINVLTKNYANFSGRARRTEYWMFVLINVMVGLVLGLVAWATKINVIPGIYSLAILVPSLAVLVRRLHDINKSWVWIFINCIPFIGWIWMLILLFKEGDHDANQYGENPKKQ